MNKFKLIVIILLTLVLHGKLLASDGERSCSESFFLADQKLEYLDPIEYVDLVFQKGFRRVPKLQPFDIGFAIVMAIHIVTWPGQIIMVQKYLKKNLLKIRDKLYYENMGEFLISSKKSRDSGQIFNTLYSSVKDLNISIYKFKKLMKELKKNGGSFFCKRLMASNGDLDKELNKLYTFYGAEDEEEFFTMYYGDDEIYGLVEQIMMFKETGLYKSIVVPLPINKIILNLREYIILNRERLKLDKIDSLLLDSDYL